MKNERSIDKTLNTRKQDKKKKSGWFETNPKIDSYSSFPSTISLHDLHPSFGVDHTPLVSWLKR